MDESSRAELIDESMIDLLALNLECTSDWRRKKAEQYPNDNRNLAATERLSELASQVRQLKGSPLHLEFDNFHRQLLDEADNDLLSSYCERENHYISRIGFDNFPDSGEECVRDLMHLAEEARQERDEAMQAAEPLQEYEAKIAALERMVGCQALEIELLKGALKRAGLRVPTLNVGEEARNGKT
jgi:hypothetical protein